MAEALTIRSGSRLLVLGVCIAVMATCLAILGWACILGYHRHTQEVRMAQLQSLCDDLVSPDVGGAMHAAITLASIGPSAADAVPCLMRVLELPDRHFPN